MRNSTLIASLERTPPQGVYKRVRACVGGAAQIGRAEREREGEGRRENNEFFFLRHSLHLWLPASSSTTLTSRTPFPSPQRLHCERQDAYLSLAAFRQLSRCLFHRCPSPPLHPSLSLSLASLRYISVAHARIRKLKSYLVSVRQPRKYTRSWQNHPLQLPAPSPSSVSLSSIYLSRSLVWACLLRFLFSKDSLSSCCYVPACLLAYLLTYFACLLVAAAAVVLSLCVCVCVPASLIPSTASVRVQV